MTINIELLVRRAGEAIPIWAGRRREIQGHKNRRERSIFGRQRQKTARPAGTGSGDRARGAGSGARRRAARRRSESRSREGAQTYVVAADPGGERQRRVALV